MKLNDKCIPTLLNRLPDIILEYTKASNEDIWIPWESDWDHGADWRISPVYYPEEGLDKSNTLWPETCKLVLESITSTEICRIGFSRLAPHQELGPHSHDNKEHKILHVGIDIPQGDVGIKTNVGTHQWTSSGEWILFDDNFTHSAWNKTEYPRTILYIDTFKNG